MLTAIIAILSKVLFLVLNINTGSFPRPLSASEEAECIRKMHLGDESARSKLIEHNLRLVAHIVKKYYSCGDSDDLISIGTIGLIKAVNTFDASKNTRLSSYASRCIENEILMYFRNEKKLSQNISMSDPIDIDKEGNPLTLMDIIFCEDSIADDLDTKLKTEQLRTFLPTALEPRELTIIKLRYGLSSAVPLTQQEVASRLGISRSYVSRIEKKALEKLRKKFNA